MYSFGDSESRSACTHTYVHLCMHIRTNIYSYVSPYILFRISLQWKWQSQRNSAILQKPVMETLDSSEKKQRLQTWACEEREWVGNIFSCIFLKDTQPYGHPHFSPLRTVLDFRPTPYKKAKLCQRRTLYLFAVFVNRKNKFIQETKTDTTERMGEIIIIVQHSQHTFGNVGN